MAGRGVKFVLIQLNTKARKRSISSGFGVGGAKRKRFIDPAIRVGECVVSGTGGSNPVKCPNGAQRAGGLNSSEDIRIFLNCVVPFTSFISDNGTSPTL